MCYYYMYHSSLKARRSLSQHLILWCVVLHLNTHVIVPSPENPHNNIDDEDEENDANGPTHSYSQNSNFREWNY